MKKLAIILLILTSATSYVLGQDQTTAPENSKSITISKKESRSQQAGSLQYFTGSVSVEGLFPAESPSRVSGGSVTFQPGARTAWHTHPAGQTLIVTSGKGLVQSWGGPIQEMRAGDVVRIPPGVKHWHGATANSVMTHTAIQEEVDGKNAEWMEQVNDEQYGSGQPSSRASADASAEKNKDSAIKKSLGDFAPKIVQITDDVLFGDVWERAELTPRDRSLITVAALTVGGNAEQLPFHLNKAKENGLTETELVEALTHLAFYCGWPKALTAINIAKETFNPSGAAGSQQGSTQP